MRFRKELVMFVYIKNFMYLLLTFIVILLCKCNYDLKYKHGNFSLLLKVVFKILHNMFCLSFFFYTTSTFTFLQFEGGSDKNTLELSYEVFLNEAKLNHVDAKARRVYSFAEKTKYTTSIFFHDNILKFSLLSEYLFVCFV